MRPVLVGAAFVLTVFLSAIGVAGWAVSASVDDYPDASDAG